MTMEWVIGVIGKATLLLTAAAALAAVLRHRSAARRHLVWTAALVSLLALPPLSAALPWRIPVLTVAAPAASPRSVAPDRSVSPVPPGSSQQRDAAMAPASPASRASPAPRPLPIPPLSTLLAALWLGGALLLMTRLVVGALYLGRVARRATELAAPDWRRPLVEAADRLELARLPRLLMSDHLPMPYASGILRPAIVLPVSAAGWSDRRRRAVLCHELAHLRRSDLLLNALGHLACAIWWFHPLAWLAARRLRTESERAADDLVLGLGTRASEYADHLLQIVCGAALARTPAIALPMAQRREFEGRMLAILGRDARRDQSTRRHVATSAALAAAVVIPLATLGVARGTASPAAPEAGVDARAADPSPGARESPAGTPQPEERPAATAAVTPVRRDTAVPAVVLAPQDTGVTRVTAALVKALDDPVADVREGAAHALGKLGLHATAPALAAHLATDPAPAAREMMAWALGQIATRGAATTALAAAARRDSSAEVRATAVWALGQLEDPASVAALADALGDPAAEVRARAAWALGILGAGPAPQALMRALRDNSSEVRATAAWALGQIEDPAAAAALTSAMGDEDREVRKAVFWALAQLPGEAAEPALLRALEHEDAEIRAMAARALGGGSLGPWPWPWPQPRP